MSNFGQTYIIAYGSLMSESSLRATLGIRPDYDHIIKLDNFRRDYVSSGRNSPLNKKFWVLDRKDSVELAPVFCPAYFDAVVSRGDHILAPVFSVNENQFKSVAAREALYTQVDVTGLVDTVGAKKRLVDRYFIFMGKAGYRAMTLDDECRVPEPYLEVCALAAKTHSEDIYQNLVSHIEKAGLSTIRGIRLGDGISY